jgi:hypothetical protein
MPGLRNVLRNVVTWCAWERQQRHGATHTKRRDREQREKMHKLGGGGGDKSTVKVKFEITFKGVSGLGPVGDKDGAREVYLAWKRGSKKGNRGETKHAPLAAGAKDAGAAQWNETFSVQATMLHYERLKKFDKKLIDVTLKEVRPSLTSASINPACHALRF